MKDPLTEIDYNELSIFTTPLGRVVQKKHMKILLGKKVPETDSELYINKMNDCLSVIAQSFWDIDLTLKLIQFAHPKIKSFKMTRVDRGEYLKYHLENYFFRLPKLKDQVLNLLNTTYQLGYIQSNGLEKKIRKEKRIIDKKLFHFLDYFDDAFSKVKPIRDTIAHRADLSDSDIAMITSHQLVPIEEDLYHDLLVRQIAHTHVMKQNQGILKQAVIILLLMLNDDFVATLDSMS